MGVEGRKRVVEQEHVTLAPLVHCPREPEALLLSSRESDASLTDLGHVPGPEGLEVLHERTGDEGLPVPRLVVFGAKQDVVANGRVEDPRGLRNVGDPPPNRARLRFRSLHGLLRLLAPSAETTEACTRSSGPVRRRPALLPVPPPLPRERVEDLPEERGEEEGLAAAEGPDAHRQGPRRNVQPHARHRGANSFLGEVEVCAVDADLAWSESGGGGGGVGGDDGGGWSGSGG
mmetsp:Transcript_21475/g.52617  ORF Transcript_21475/g.52617 Transcript_21475/m.52617 type:complete len:232 (-) Transcript_21475:572-1267(-)